MNQELIVEYLKTYKINLKEYSLLHCMVASAAPLEYRV